MNSTRAFSSFAATDIPAAKAFYSETVGVKATQEDDMLYLHVTDGNPIMVYPKADHTPATYTVLNFQVANLEDAMADLRSRGVRFEQYDTPDVKTDADGIFSVPGVRQAWFKDPSGNVLSVLQET